MPTYQYECDACGHGFEHLQSMMDKKLRQCPNCKKFELHRLIGTGAGIIFKGSGFYETDYKKSSAGSASDKSASNDVKKSETGAKTEKNKQDTAKNNV